MSMGKVFADCLGSIVLAGRVRADVFRFHQFGDQICFYLIKLRTNVLGQANRGVFRRSARPMPLCQQRILDEFVGFNLSCEEV